MDSKALIKQFSGMAKFFKKQAISKHNKNKLESLPWIITIGQPEAGKSSLLAYSGLRFIFSKKTKPVSQQECLWWVTNKISFLDIPGKYLLTDENGNNGQWPTLCKLINKHHQPNPMGGVIVTLDVHDIYHRSSASINKRLSQIRMALKMLAQQYKKPLPVHIILNKADLIPGFNEFFDNLNIEDREQTWGFLLGNEKDEDKLTNILHLEFNLLIKQLNQQLVKQLHFTQDETNRALIKGFPLQLEKVKEVITGPLASFISQLNQINTYCINGVYFTSCQQHDIIEENTENVLTQNHHKSFFIKQTLDHVATLSHHQPRNKNKKFNKTQFTVMTLCAASIIGVTFYLASRFSQHVAAVSQIDNIIAAYGTMEQQTAPLSLIQSEGLLEKLSKATTQLSNEQKNIVTHYILSSKNDSAINRANLTYRNLLAHAFLPAISNYLESIMANHDNEPQKQYIALKIYLMLGGKIKINPNYIAYNINNVTIEQDHFTKTSIEQIKHFILDATQKDFEPVTTKKDLIYAARKKLNSLQPNELAYVLLYANTGSGDPISIGKNLPSDIFTVDPSYETIPSIYSLKELKVIYPDLLTAIAHEVQSGSKVLGERSPIPGLSDKGLIRQLGENYLKQYVSTWSDALNHIQLKPNTSWEDLHKALLNLSEVDSPILYLLQTVNDNTNSRALNKDNPQLSDINKLINNLTSPDKSDLYKTFKSMQAFANTVSDLQNNKQQAFDLAKAYATGDQQDLPKSFLSLQKLSGSLPAPLNGWLSQILTDTWKLLLKDTGNYINAQWKTQVLQPFQEQLAGQYPFKLEAKQDATFDQLNHFFNAKGTLETFEENYLFPFVSTQDGNWQVKPEFASVLGIPDIVLTELQRYTVMQTMFYESGGTTPHVEFTLEPKSVSKNISKFNLMIGKQNIIYNTKTPNPPVTLAWPTPEADDSVTLTFTDIDGKNYNKKFEGPWAWMKIVNQFQTSNSPVTNTHATLKFDIGSGSNAIYTLDTHGQYNAFDANFFAKTWMPHWVFETK